MSQDEVEEVLVVDFEVALSSPGDQIAFFDLLRFLHNRNVKVDDPHNYLAESLKQWQALYKNLNIAADDLTFPWIEHVSDDTRNSAWESMVARFNSYSSHKGHQSGRAVLNVIKKSVVTAGIINMTKSALSYARGSTIQYENPNPGSSGVKKLKSEPGQLGVHAEFDDEKKIAFNIAKDFSK